MALKIFLHIPDDHACTYYRAMMPFLHLYDELNMQKLHITASNQTLKYEDFDIFIFNRLIRPQFYQEVVEPNLKLGKKFVWQCDDDLWNIPDWNPAYKKLDHYDLATTDLYIKNAMAVWVSTDKLAELVGHPEKTKILPNLINLSHYNDEVTHDQGPIKILWCGSGSHDKDLDVIIEPITKIASKFGREIAIIFWGYLPTGLANFEREPGYPYASLVPKYENVFFGDWFSSREYFHKLRPLKPDIAIMPLTDCKFNYSKSNLKYLEMSMAGAACIATNLPPYQCIKDKETGLLIEPNDADGWYKALETLIISPEYRLKLNQGAREQIWQRYSWDSPSRLLWSQAFLDLARPT